MPACKAVRVRAYASAANLGLEFAILAMSITSFYDEVEVAACEKMKLKFMLKKFQPLQ